MAASIAWERDGKALVRKYERERSRRRYVSAGAFSFYGPETA
jgi:hypothetical protein